MKHPAETKVDSSTASPPWEADAKLDDLTKLTPSRPEQHGDLVFGEDGKPAGIYVVTNATPKFARRDASLMIDGELDFDGPNPFGERALDIYGQAVGQIESGNRSEITSGYNNHYQGRYQMGRDCFGTNPEIYISAVMIGLAAGQEQLGDDNGS